MAKPRIIIADTDVNYIIPLQLRFIKEYWEKIELEIITEESYFNEVFTRPQNVDILIVSEDLYSQSILRHNIANIFIMREENEQQNIKDSNVNSIFKYTNIMEIFYEIIGKSAAVLNLDKENKKETQVVMVYSASGGVGKTTIAMGISACLAKNYKKVLYINAECLQSFQRMLENESPISETDVYSKLLDIKDTTYGEIKNALRKEEFYYLPPFKASLMSLGLSFSVYEKLISEAKKLNDFEYIIIDVDSTFNEEKARLFEIADKVLVLTDQSASSVYATNVLVSNITGVSSGKYIFICNNFSKQRDNAFIQKEFEIKFSLNEYIQNNERYRRMKCKDFVNDHEIQKIAFLIM